MNWYIKIPGIELETWAPAHHWDRLFEMWWHAGITGIVVPVNLSDQLDGFQDRVQTIVQMAHRFGLKSWLIIPVLNNPVFYFRYPEARPVHRLQEAFSFPKWFAPICPTCSSYHDFFAHSVTQLLQKIGVDVVLLDYLRVPYFWEEWGNLVKPEQWPLYCYCPRCQQQFQQHTEAQLETTSPQLWQDWQCQVLADWLNQIHQLLLELHPRLQLGVQILPLVSEKKRLLRSEWVGQNLQILQKTTHFFSPLVYNQLLNWQIDDALYFLIELLCAQRLPIVPSFQISTTPWDRQQATGKSLNSLIHRLEPMGLQDATLFHARDLLNEKAIHLLLD